MRFQAYYVISDNNKSQIILNINICEQSLLVNLFNISVILFYSIYTMINVCYTMIYYSTVYVSYIHSFNTPRKSL